MPFRTAMSYGRAFGEVVATCTPLSLLATLSWEQLSPRVSAFLIALSLLTSTAIGLFFFFLRTGKSARRIWDTLLGAEDRENLFRKEVTDGLGGMQAGIENLTRMNATQNALLRGLQDISPNMFTFEADSEGRWIWTSDPLEIYLDRRPLLGLDWISLIEPHERTNVKKEWALCVMERRLFECNVNFTNGKSMTIVGNPIVHEGHLVSVQGHCKPIAQPLMSEIIIEAGEEPAGT